MFVNDMNLNIIKKIIEILVINISLIFFYHTYVRAEPLNLKLGGKIEEYFSYNKTENRYPSKFDKFVVISDIGINLRGDIQINENINLLLYTEIEAKNSVFSKKLDAYIDEKFIDMTSTLGIIRIGRKEGFNYNLTQEPPFQLIEDDEIIGTIIPNQTSFNLKDIFSFERFTKDSFQYGYQTPNIKNFTLGLNFFPGNFNNLDNQKNAKEISINWKKFYRGNAYSISTGFFKSEFPGTKLNNKVWNLSSRIKIGNFIFGGTHIYSKKANTHTSDFLGLAINYNIGAFGFNASLLNGNIINHFEKDTYEKIHQYKIESAYKLLKELKIGISAFATSQNIRNINYKNTAIVFVFLTKF